MTEILLVNPRVKSGEHKKSLPPPMDDADTIVDDKFNDYLPCHLVTALSNAGVYTIGDLKKWAHSDRFRMTKNIGPIGRDHVRRLLSENIDGGGFSVRAERGSLQGLAKEIRETTSQARVDWFRTLGKHLREEGFTHSLVDELEAYSE